MFRSLYWRPDRITHIARKHGITTEQVEEVVFEDLQRVFIRGPGSESHPDKYIYYVLGRTSSGRHLMIVLLDEGHGIALPVTAREMSASERRRYERRKSR